jgi:hypothetical protein
VAELTVGLALPNASESIIFEITHTVRCIFIKTTGHDAAIPGDDAGVPHLPAMIEELIFNAPFAVGTFAIAGIFFVSGN